MQAIFRRISYTLSYLSLFKGKISTGPAYAPQAQGKPPISKTYDRNLSSCSHGDSDA
jgi:hypothetical protein